MDTVKEDVYLVERVLKTRKYKGQVQCFVKWANWSNKHNSWVPKADIFQVQHQDAESASKETEPATGKNTAAAIEEALAEEGKPSGQDEETTEEGSEQTLAEEEGKPAGQNEETTAEGSQQTLAEEEGKPAGQDEETTAEGSQQTLAEEEGKPAGQNEETTAEGSQQTLAEEEGKPAGQNEETTAEGSQQTLAEEEGKPAGQDEETTAEGSQQILAEEEGKPAGQDEETTAEGSQQTLAEEEGKSAGQDEETTAEGSQQTLAEEEGKSAGQDEETTAEGREPPDAPKEGLEKFIAARCKEGHIDFLFDKYKAQVLQHGRLTARSLLTSERKKQIKELVVYHDDRDDELETVACIVRNLTSPNTGQLYKKDILNYMCPADILMNVCVHLLREYENYITEIKMAAETSSVIESICSERTELEQIGVNSNCTKESKMAQTNSGSKSANKKLTECKQSQQRKKAYQSEAKVPHRIAYVNESLLLQAEHLEESESDSEDATYRKRAYQTRTKSAPTCREAEHEEFESDSNDLADPTYKLSEVSDSESENEIYDVRHPRGRCYNLKIPVANESVTEGRKSRPRERAYQAKTKSARRRAEQLEEEEYRTCRKRVYQAKTKSAPTQAEHLQGSGEIFEVQSPKRACLNLTVNLAAENVTATKQSQPKEKTYMYQAKSEKNTAKDSYKKPYRFCIFCQSLKSKLSAHIREQHGEEERVKIAMALPKSARDKAFQGFKKEGILQQNKAEVTKADPKYSREKSSEHKNAGELVMCSICEGFYSKVYIKRHQNKCRTESESSSCDAKPIRLNMFKRFTDKEDSHFVMNILGRFRVKDDPVGKMHTTDPVLMEIGKKLWSKEKRKVDRKGEVRRGVMRDMRRIGTVYQEMLNSEETMGPLKVKKGAVSDIFHCSNFKHLEEAVETMTRKEDQSGIKAGLKHCLYYLLKSASRIVKVLYIADNDDVAAAGVDKFVSLFEMNHNFIFGDASYQINNARESKLRRPAERPLETDIAILRDHILNRTEELLRDEYDFMSLHQYIELRNLTLCRLTLFNARRGGEPTQLFIKHWDEAEKGVWLDQQNLGQLDPLDAAIADTLKITFQTGKRNALVPVLFPKDTIQCCQVLSREEVRRSVGISPQNLFLFPSTTSEEHVFGWHVMDAICQKLGLEKLVNATKNRHRISTAFALLDVPEEDRPYIYRHLGHSEDVNKNVYQDPLALKELTVVGKRLLQIDETCATGLASSLASARETTTNTTVSSSSVSARETPTDTTVGLSRTTVSRSNEEAASVSSDTAGETATDATAPQVATSGQFPREAASVSSNTAGETPSDTTAPQVATSGQFPRVRKYTHWGDEKTTVDNYFASYIDLNEEKRLPGKKEVKKFLSLHPDFPHDDKVIHARVMNRVYAREKMAKDRLKKMKTYKVVYLVCQRR